MQQDVREKASELIQDWYNWSDTYRPSLGARGMASECRNSTATRQWDTTTDITRETCDKIDMAAVEYCYNELPFEYQNAIGVEMKNRQVGKTVWRSIHGKTYEEALDMIIPHMRAKNLL